MSTTLSSSSFQSAYPGIECHSHYGIAESGSRTEIVRPTVIRYDGYRASGSLKFLLTASLAASLYANSATMANWNEPVATTVMPKTIRVQAGATSEPLVATISESAQVAYLLDNLISNRSALADILGISRTALYDWMAGKPVSPENSAHLNRISACVLKAASGRSAKLYHRYVTERILAKTAPLAQLLKNLKDEHFDQTPILALLAKAWDMSEERDSKDRSLDQRLANRAFPELSSEQRRTNAEHNRFMQDLRRGERG